MADQPPSLVLASGSPRRQQLLTEAGIDFDVVIPDVDEAAIGQQILDKNGSPTDYVTALATAKVNTVSKVNNVSDTLFTLSGSTFALCLAADTVVVHRGRILGKPANRNDARATVLGMSGDSVDVLTAVAASDGISVDGRVVTTTLVLRPLSPAEVHRYVASGAADDKAGGLAVQDDAADFITDITGCFSNVVGLPMCEVADLLKRAEAGELSRREPEPHRAPECLCPTAS